MKESGRVFSKQEQKLSVDSPWGELLIASCRSGTDLATRVVEHVRQSLRRASSADEFPVADRYGRCSCHQIDFQFSDSETCVRIEVEVAGRDVFLFQALFDPQSGRSIDENYMGFLLAARAFREFGASRVTGILPYLAYARQDKPTLATREPTSAKLMADLSVAAGVERLVTLQPHAAQIHGFYGTMPVTVLDMAPIFVDHFRHLQHRNDVIVVAPDAGAAKWVQQFCQTVDLPIALAAKYRPRPEEAVISAILGDFSGKRVALVLDDMISSGGTVYELSKKLIAENGIEEIYFGVAHNLCNETANQRLSELWVDGYLQEVFVTNSIPQTTEFRKQPFVSVHDLSDMLCEVIGGIHHNRM